MKNFNFCLFSPSKNGKKIVWEITSQCNMFCQHCCVDALRKTNFNEFIFSNQRLIKQRINEMLSFGIKEFYISGGEPLLAENIFNLLEFLKRNNVKLNIATNGYCLNKKIIKKFTKIGVNLLHVSLDGHLPEIHNNLRGGNFFNKIKENLIIVRKYKIPIRIGCIIWKQNENFLKEMVKFCLKLRIKELRFSWLIKVGRFKKHPKIYPKRKWISVMKEMKDLKEKYEDKIKISIHRNPFIKENKNVKICPGAEKLFFLNSEGKLFPCSWIAKTDSRFSTKQSLKETKFENLVNSKPMLEFKKLLIKRKNENINGCPFISKYLKNSYYLNDNLTNL